MRFFVLLQKVSIEEFLPVFSELADDDADTVEKLTDTYEFLRNTTVIATMAETGNNVDKHNVNEIQ